MSDEKRYKVLSKQPLYLRIRYHVSIEPACELSPAEILEELEGPLYNGGLAIQNEDGTFTLDVYTD